MGGNQQRVFQHNLRKADLRRIQPIVCFVGVTDDLNISLTQRVMVSAGRPGMTGKRLENLTLMT